MSPIKKPAMSAAEFSEMLNEWLLIEGNTLVKLAKDLEVMRMTIWRWKNGERTIDKFTAQALKKYFKKSK